MKNEILVRPNAYTTPLRVNTIKHRALYRPYKLPGTRVKQGENSLAFIDRPSPFFYRITKSCRFCTYYKHSLKGFGTIKASLSKCSRNFPLGCPFRTCYK